MCEMYLGAHRPSNSCTTLSLGSAFNNWNIGSNLLALLLIIEILVAITVGAIWLQFSLSQDKKISSMLLHLSVDWIARGLDRLLLRLLLYLWSLPASRIPHPLNFDLISAYRLHINPETDSVKWTMWMDVQEMMIFNIHAVNSDFLPCSRKLIMGNLRWNLDLLMQ